MVKVKTSIYIEQDVWEAFKRYARRRGVEVSNLLEDIIRNEVLMETLDEALLRLAGQENYEIDFEPIELEGRYEVSKLVRVMRNERIDSILRQ